MLRPIYRAPSLSSHFCPLPLASFASPLRPHICAGPVSIAGRNALRTSAVSSSHLHLAHFHWGRVSKRPLGPPSSRCQLAILAPKAPISAGLLAPPSQSQLPTPTHTLPRSPTSPGRLRGGPWETSSDPPNPLPVSRRASDWNSLLLPGSHQCINRHFGCYFGRGRHIARSPRSTSPRHPTILPLS